MGTKKERILQKLNPILLKMTPKLSGNAGSFIDLDSEDSLEDGAKKLMMRFFRNQDLCEKNKRSQLQSNGEVTISSAKYNDNEEICELITEKLFLPSGRNDETDMSERPGQSLQKLKIELQEKMSAKWEKEYFKRLKESKSFEMKHKKNKNLDCSSDGDCDTEDEDRHDSDEKSDEDNCLDDDEADDKSQNEDKKFDELSMCSNEQNDDDNSYDSLKGETAAQDEDYEEETCSLVPAYQPGGGLLYGGSELTQNDEELPQNLMSPSLRLSINESPESKIQSQFQSFSDRTPKSDSGSNEDCETLFIEKNKLYSPNPNNSFDLNDAFEFCSGKFPDISESQSAAEGNLEKSDCDSDIDDDNDVEEENEESEDGGDSAEEIKSLLDESCEGSTRKHFPKTRKNIVAFDDSEEEEDLDKKTENAHPDEEEANSAVLKSLLSDDEDDDEGAVGANNGLKVRKKSRKILHFSDEEEEEEVNGEVGVADNAAESVVNDEGEEDEIRSVHYDSEENEIINPKEFFEKEAELSGSEWSGDEDERGLDELDVEEGDADHLDSSQVRSQLEKIHIRRVLDDDAREVRLIQEILFEDGDLHDDGKRRDRKFKWKNLGTFEEEENNGGEKEGNDSEDDGAEEDHQRKLRFEKEMFLMAKKKSGEESSDDEIITDVQMIKVTRVKTTTNIEDKTEKVKAVREYEVQSFRNSSISNARGSFLTRNEEFLSRLAKATAAVSDNVLGTKHSKNFVFASKSPERTIPERKAARKRQTEDAESCGRQEKKAKVPHPEVDAGPSILDLLV